MKAVWFEKFGNADEVLKYGDFTTPLPGDREVLIRLKTSGINPSDTKKRSGSSPGLLKDGPVIPHSDGAGIIEAVGAGIDRSRIGEHVWLYNAQYSRQHGTAAEYIAIDAGQAIRLPDNTAFEVGACMGIPAMTAHRCVTADGSVADQTLLVTGGAGRVGHYAIQWAKHFGARVIATAASEESRRHCREAGADLVADHPGAETTGAIKEFTNGQGVDRVIEGEFAANLNSILDVLKNNGTISTYASMTDPTPKIPFYRMMFKDLTVRLVLVYAMPEEAKKNAAKDITHFLEAAKLKHRIAHNIPITESAKGHQLIETGGFFGCVILDCGKI